MKDQIKMPKLDNTENMFSLIKENKSELIIPKYEENTKSIIKK